MVQMIFRIGVSPGNTSRAVEWARKLHGYEKKAGLRSASLLRPITGDDTSHVVIESQFSSMSEFEEEYRKRRADNAWLEIAKELTASGWFLGESRQIYDVVD